MQSSKLTKPNISVIVLTKNEEEVISDCLESVKWADEVVVVDDSSTDGTLNIVKKFGIKKIVNAPPKKTFSDRRNLGRKAANEDWLLYVDADERVTPTLKSEIIKTIEQCHNKTMFFSAFAIPRRNIRLTKELHFGGWWPDYVIRLIRKDKLVGWEGELHEQPRVNGGVGRLKEAFVHFSHRGSLEHKLRNTINWSQIEARKLYEANHPPMNIRRFSSAMAREFYLRMIKYQAYRDGLEGIIEAIYQVFSVFITYARLYELQQKSHEGRNF